MSLELECGGGFVLLGHVTPLTRRDAIYFYSRVHIWEDDLSSIGWKTGISKVRMSTPLTPRAYRHPADS
jgi:hypothetical protein